MRQTINDSRTLNIGIANLLIVFLDVTVSAYSPRLVLTSVW